MTPHEYYLSVNGKKIDMDGYYGGQCWDLYAHYMKTLGYKYANCTTTGYVKDIWNNRKTNGMLDSCIEVSVNAMQDGDIAVWGNCDACPKSHIAIFRKDNGNGTGIFLGQNQSGQYVDQKSFTYTGIIGVFRPKCYVVKNTCPFKKSGTVEAIETNIRVRTAPSLSKGDTGLRYQPGERLIYNDVVEADGWYWAKYTRSLNGASGTGYCALCKTDGSSKFWKQV
nr:MAG TPA: Adenosylhomocysteinase [Caudoviricetes sp.]